MLRRRDPPAAGAAGHDRALAGQRPQRLSWEESLLLDLRYVDNWSLTLDATILWRTWRAVVGRSGAY
jgi:lipopolysaccharide/colanic/teichoic acid biosynthesis glycosyltransferase